MIRCIKNLIHISDTRTRFFTSLQRPGRILELGCGPAGNCRALRTIYPEVETHGVDLSDCNEADESVIYKRVDLDVDPLPYPDEYFDAVIFTHVIEHMQRPLALGVELYRVMSKGGVVYCETPNWTSALVPSFGFKREQYGPFNFFDEPTHVKPWTKQALFQFIHQSCGLRVRELGTVRNWPRIPLDIARILHGLVRGDRREIMRAFWNVYGWSIYGIGVKD